MRVAGYCRRGILPRPSWVRYDDAPAGSGKMPLLLLLATLVVATGCGRGTSDTAPVTGTITLDGQPLTQGTVVFMPEKGLWAKGAIGSDGSFRVATANGDGASIGLNRVTICCVEPGTGTEDKPAKWLIPPHYGNPATSGLSFDVKAGIDNTARFDLTRSDPPNTR